MATPSAPKPSTLALNPNPKPRTLTLNPIPYLSMVRAASKTAVARLGDILAAIGGRHGDSKQDLPGPRGPGFHGLGFRVGGILRRSRCAGSSFVAESSQLSLLVGYLGQTFWAKRLVFRSFHISCQNLRAALSPDHHQSLATGSSSCTHTEVPMSCFSCFSISLVGYLPPL